MFNVARSALMLAAVVCDKLTAKLNSILCEKGDLTRKDLLRSSSGACPCCLSNQVSLADNVPYFKTHLRKWNTGFLNYHKMIPANYRYAFFDVNVCGNCGLVYVPESYSGLVEYVENHQIYYAKSIRHYLETVHLVMTNGEFDKIVSSDLSDLDSVEQRYKLIGAILREHIPDGCNYLDLGSNYGTCTEFIRRLFPTIHVTGVEINDNFVKSSRKYYAELNIVSGDICDKAVGKFDFIYCSDVIEHIWDLDAFVDGIISACADNALVLLITPNADSPEARLQGKDWWSFIVPHHAQILGMRSLDKLMERKGFVHVDSGVIGQELWAVYRLPAPGDCAGAGQRRELQ